MRYRLLVAILALALLAALVPVAPAAGAPSVSLRFLAHWRVTRPVTIESAGDGTGRLFIVEQDGRIRLVSGGVLRSTPFLDIRSKVSSGGERGLLGLAFPPGFAGKQYFYVDYTNLAGDTVIARYQVSGDPDIASAASEQILLTIDQPYANHNGGQIAFGPDGYLYIGMGDGGSSGDPLGNGQKTTTLLGKILRIDTESGAPTYAVPATNPFVGMAGHRPEIWALGMRNPWRFSFDRTTGGLYIADVGQNAWEEIDYEPPGFAGGRNYGWDWYEGNHPYPAGTTPKPTGGLTFPVHEYGHGATGGHSITGGYVYRGAAYPNFSGVYFFADWEVGKYWAMSTVDYSAALLLDTDMWPSTFGQAEDGELYMADWLSGTVFRLVDATTPHVASVARLSGTDRYLTANAVALDAFPSGCTTAVVATGEGFADALSASGLAGAVGGPVLLTPSRTLQPSLLSVLGPSGLGVSDVIIVGGTGAVSSGVEQGLADAGYTVTRVSGSNRYATAASVAGRVAAIEGPAYSGNVFIARGDDFADALSAAPLAYAGRGPVLLVSPTVLPAVTGDAIASIGATEAVVVGGTAAISGAVAGQLGVPYARVSGGDRFATATALAAHALGRTWVDYSYVGIATGLNYPDGLAGGAGAGTRGGVLLLTQPTSLPASTASALIAHQGDVSAAAVYGGAAAVSADTGRMIRWHLP